MIAELETTLPHHPNELSTHWLTLCLKYFGHLERGEVVSIKVDVNARWNLAQTARARVAYSAEAGPEAPTHLFVKIANHDDPLGGIFAGEFDFYQQTPTDGLPLATCYAAVRDARSARSVILLADLNTTHTQPRWPTAPSTDLITSSVDALARLHAHWWADSRCLQDSALATLRANEQGLGDFFQPLSKTFLDALGTQLSRHERESVRAACLAFPRLKQRRINSGLPVTRTHGDPHFWNVFYPNDAPARACVFIDWEDWRVDMGAADLGAMLVLHWQRKHRLQQEKSLLRTYHDALLAYGVADYDRQALQADYQLGHLQNIVVPVFQHHAGINDATWQPTLQRWLAAFDDLGCAELL